MSLREHLSELKRRFKVAFGSFIVLLAILLIVPADPETFLSQGYTGFTPVIAFFISRVKLELFPPGWKFIAVSINEPLEIYIVASVLFAVIFNAPIFAYETIKFVSPGLKESERKLIYPFVAAITGLFAFGAAFGFFFLAKFLLAALTPFFTFTGIVPPTIDAANFYFIVFLTIAMSGIAFTVPVYVYTLIRFGVIQAASFRKNRIIIWAITYILCAIITPDGGPFLDVLLFVPIITLLEVAVFIGGRSRAGVLKKQARDEGRSGAAAPPSGPAPPPPPGSGVSPTDIQVGTTVAAPAAAPAVRTACPYCNFPISPGTAFCPNCNRAIE
jgi:sec-independent protein translocase protein TatC